MMNRSSRGVPIWIAICIAMMLGCQKAPPAPVEESVYVKENRRAIALIDERRDEMSEKLQKFLNLTELADADPGLSSEEFVEAWWVNAPEGARHFTMGIHKVSDRPKKFNSVVLTELQLDLYFARKRFEHLQIDRVDFLSAVNEESRYVRDAASYVSDRFEAGQVGFVPKPEHVKRAFERLTDARFVIIPRIVALREPFLSYVGGKYAFESGQLHCRILVFDVDKRSYLGRYDVRAENSEKVDYQFPVNENAEQTKSASAALYADLQKNAVERFEEANRRWFSFTFFDESQPAARRAEAEPRSDAAKID